MSQVICSSCFEVEDTTKRFIELPYVCALCEKDSALAIEQDTYNSGVPCQESNLDTLAKLMRNPSILETLNARGQTVDYEELNAFIRANHNSDILDQFDEDTKLIDDLRLQLEQANLNVQILEETIEDLETQLTDLRLDICNVVFRTHF